MPNDVPQSTLKAVLQKTTNSSNLETPVKGYDWSAGINYDRILQCYYTTGFQATNFGLAVTELNKMLDCRMKNLPVGDNQYIDSCIRTNCTIFLGYTSNIVSSGLRETLCYLVRNKMVDCIVTTAGGIEEDIIKCLAPTYLGDFHLDGVSLRENGINRIGNLLVPNNNYCLFENWIAPILDELVDELVNPANDTILSPSLLIRRLGERIANENSICYWAAINDIPIFCPAITDGSLGDMIFMHSFRKPGLKLDIVSDLWKINMLAIRSLNTGIIILGGGLVKHHICNANLMRNGADFAVFVNTGSEFDGSDAGARPDEAKSWGKIKKEAKPVKVYADATLVFPLLVAQTFAKHLTSMAHSSYENSSCTKEEKRA